MPRYSDEILEQVKSRNDIVDVISQYIALKRSGRNYFGVCPFHNEKTPSLSVSPDRQIFKCFGCGVGGNVFQFVSKIENLSFGETVELLAERASIELPKLGSEDEKTSILKSKVYSVNEEAAKFFHENLYKNTSKDAQEYVKKRKLDNNTLKAFMIGYAEDNNSLLEHLKQKGFKEEEMRASGLIGKSNDGRLYDKFRGRLMFPIQDVRGKVIAFGGRVLIPEDERKKIEETGKKMPKYINSPEDIVYSKGRNLFGLNVAKKANNGMMKRILVVEGYMDAISLYKCGITNVVASLGTALTDAQARLLRKNAEQVILGYDADGAGQNAIIRAMDILKNMGVDIRVLQISGAKDPDEFVVKYGSERFKKCMDESISLVEFKAKVLKKSLNTENVNDRIKFLNELAKILSEVDNTMERELYIERIAKAYSVSKEAIFAEVNKLLYKNNNVSIKTLDSSKAKLKPIKDLNKEDNSSKSSGARKISESTINREKMLIYLLMNNPKESYERIKKAVSIDDIQDETNKLIVTKIYEKDAESIDPDSAMNWFEDEEVINYLSGILMQDFEINEKQDIDKAIEDIEKTFVKESKLARRDEIILLLEDKENLSEDEYKKLENELNDIIIELAKMR